MLGCFIIKKTNNRICCFHEQALKIVYNNYQSPFEELFNSGKLKFQITLLGLDFLGVVFSREGQFDSPSYFKKN